MSIQKNVEKHIEILKKMTISELIVFGKKEGYNNRQSFSRFKKALELHGIQYSKMLHENRNKKDNDRRAKAKYTVTLITDASAKYNKFAITDKTGQPVWYGQFFESDLDYNGDQSTAEMACAKKAVWLASKIANAIEIEVIELHLITDAQWLCYATCPSGLGGGKSKKLKYAADKYNVVLDIEHIPGKNNPADKYTRMKGFKKWLDNDLRSLAEKK